MVADFYTRLTYQFKFGEYDFCHVTNCICLFSQLFYFIDGFSAVKKRSEKEKQSYKMLVIACDSNFCYKLLFGWIFLLHFPLLFRFILFYVFLFVVFNLTLHWNSGSRHLNQHLACDLFSSHCGHEFHTNKVGEKAERNRNRIRSVTETNRTIWIKVEILYKNIVQHAVCRYEWLTANVAQMLCFVSLSARM